MKGYTKFSVSIDSELDQLLSQLKVKLHKSSKEDTFRLAIALLKTASKVRDDGLKLAIANDNNDVLREIVLA